MIQPSSEFVIFVTHVEPDDAYLKIWGQVDKTAAALVERHVHALMDYFNQGYGCPSKTNRLMIGALCCARFQTEGYYRAKVLNVQPDGLIVVQFIDYGNIEVVSPNEVHLLEQIPGSEPLQTIAAVAAEFTLANVMPLNCVWENRTIETIKRNLCYTEYRATLVHTINNYCLIKLWYKNEDFSEVLVKQHMAMPTTIQEMFRPKHMLQPQMPLYQQNKGNMNNFATMPMMQNPNMNHTDTTNMFHKTFPTGISPHKHIAQMPPLQSPPVQEALVFKSRVLDVGSRHEVLISCVEDGPQKFSVQVQSTKDVLTRLMNEINSHPKQSLQEPPLPGSVCLGRYTGDGVLCRAVVMSVMEHKCKLYYVDFGHTEVLPYTDIFQLPPEYINPKVLSIRFTLSGLKELNVTQDMKKYFTELVHRKVLVLHVRPPEGPPLIQYGDLYDNNVNVKDMLKKAFPSPATVIPITYSYPQLRRLSKDVQEIVFVSYVESCKKFFVQLESGAKSLESIMAGLAQYANTAAVLNAGQLKTGLPCAALYESQWYRAQIINVTGDQVKVVYVDYGNEEELPIMSIRSIHDDLVTKLPAQALKCALNGYEVLSSDQDVSNHFERLTLEKRFYMKVVAAQPNGLLVDLFEFDTMRSIHPQLLNNLFCDKTENSTISSRNEDVKTVNEFQSGDKNRYNKKNNTDSWNYNQNAKSFEDNKPNTWKDREKQYDNRYEKVNTSFRREQNDRFSKDETPNNRYGRDRSYNKYDKGEANTFNRNVRGTPRDGGSRFNNSNERGYNRNNSGEKTSFSDKDSDSSKDSVKRGKGGFNGSFNNDRGGSRDGGVSSNRLQSANYKTRVPTTEMRTRSTNWNNKKPTRSDYQNERSNGDYSTSNNEFKENNVSFNQTNTEESWGTNDANTELQNNSTANRESQFSSMSITLGAVKNGEVVFTNSPSDFFVQLNPDCLELDTIMENIAATYENVGETLQVSKIQCGVCCIAQYSEDLKWYRAIIKSVEENSATVEFADYGNIESVDFEKIKAIREEFLQLSMQAVHCKLFGLTDAKNESESIFSENVDGKSLEVEFVAETNGVYEVLLREVVDGVPNTNYINEEFCAGVGLTQAKATAVNSKASNVTTNKMQVAPDYAPPDSKWQMSLYEPGSTHDVIVTWFINPNKFYCQMLTKDAEFKAMMNEIQKTYADKKPATHTLQVGSAVIAMFSEDKALYRGEIINTQNNAYVVQYIDFGNCALVNQRNVYSVEKKFMQLPRLAIQCSLKNIVPNNNSLWSEMDSDALDNCFNADKYECIYHNFNDDQYIISLTHNGQDVGDMLVQRNLAAFAAKTLATETIDVAEAKVVEIVDIKLLSGQTFKMTISNVENTNQFYVQLPSASKCENIVNNYMADKNTEVMPRLSSREMCLGAGCLINANGTWRRAVVIDCSRSVGFDVRLIDTGARDEIQDGALALPGELAGMQNQALSCSLYNVSSSPHVDEQLKKFEGKKVLVHVEEVCDNRLLVTLYDLRGNKIINTEEEDAKISLVCPMPILSSTHKVSVSYANNSTNIWLQRYSDIKIETKLIDDLNQYYAEPRERLKPEVHLLCAAKCSDDQWYRAKIISYTETTASVHYIDYGNDEEVALESVMMLEPQFYEPHQLAINASLSIVLSGTEDEQINLLQTHLMNKELTAVFYNVHKKWIVDLFDNGEKFSDKCRALNLMKEEEQPASGLAHDETSTIGRFDVCVTHVDSPSQFWLQRIDESASLSEKQDQLQVEVPDFPAIEGILEEGSLCVAVFSIDNLWYRAEVLDADEDITTVRFIDYGNTDVIDNNAGSIRQMPDAWRSLQRYAQKCRLDVIPVDTEDWNETACERFSNLVMSDDTVQALVVADTAAFKRVELFIGGKSVSETLVEEKLAIIINTEQEPVDEIVDLELDPHSAFVCHVNSPSEFWVQEEKLVADLEVMADRFIVADMFGKIDDVKEGLLCVAKYPDDDRWYRARVISHGDNGTQVMYIDYGNSAVSTEIRVIPDDLASIPPLSRKCCLELPAQIKEWSEQARKEFVTLAADGRTIFLLDVLKEQETSLVKLTLDGQNIADVLASMCEQHSPVIEERLPPLGEENSPNVLVSYISSPSEFWIQAERSISELEVMSARLSNAESFLMLNSLDVGTICAAQYPDDEYWYRAKIVARHENSTEVLYIDYGNSAVTKELRVLPEDMVNIPTLSKRCALEKPSHIVAWSEKACKKFKELAAEGETMFQFETLDENDPMHVQLNLNGTNVVDLLSAECEEAAEEEQVLIHDDQLVSDSETIFKLNEEAQQEQDNQTNLKSNNLKCDNQIENVTDEGVLNEPLESNVNENYEYNELQKCITSEEDPGKTGSEVAAVGITSEMKVTSDDVSATVETNKDSDVRNETISAYVVTPDAPCSEKLIATELSVDKIVESMTENVSEDVESQNVDDTNLPVASETQPQDVAQPDTNEQQMTATSDDISTAVEASEDSDFVVRNETISAYVATPDAPCSEKLIATELNVDEIVESMIENVYEDVESQNVDDTNLPVASKTQPQDVAQTDTNEQQMKATSGDISTAVEASEDTDFVVSNEMIPTIVATSDAACAERPVTTELSVDEIVESMIKNASEDVESQNIDKDNTNSSVANETQPQDIAQTDTEEQQESQTQSVDTNKFSDAQIMESTTRDVTEDLDSKVSSVTDESQGITQLDTSHTKEMHPEMQSDVNEAAEHQTSVTASLLPEEQATLEQAQRPSPAKDETVSGNADKDASNPNYSDLEVQSESADMDNESNASSGSACTVRAAESFVSKTDPAEQCGDSRSRSENKTLPECSEPSGSELPDPEAKRPTTPRTPYSEKLVAGAVNPFVFDSASQNETLTVYIEDNIPRHEV